MDLFWTPEALADREAVYTYTEADNPRAAMALDEDISAHADRLRQHPHLGRPGRGSKARANG